MIYAWRYPKQHPPLGDDRRQPARSLPLGRQDDRRADPPLRRALREGRRPAGAGRPTSPPRSTPSYEHVPGHLWFLPIKKGNAKVGAFFGLMNATPDGGGPLAGPLTIDTLLSADKGDGSGAWLLSLMAQLIFPDVQVWGDVASVGRSDAAHARRFFATARQPRIGHRQPRHRLHLGRRPTDRLLAGKPGRERVHARPGLERRDAPDRRQPRLRHAAAVGDARAAAAPRERPPGRPHRTSATPTTSGPTSRRRARI